MARIRVVHAFWRIVLILGLYITCARGCPEFCYYRVTTNALTCVNVRYHNLPQILNCLNHNPAIQEIGLQTVGFNCNCVWVKFFTVMKIKNIHVLPPRLTVLCYDYPRETCQVRTRPRWKRHKSDPNLQKVTQKPLTSDKVLKTARKTETWRQPKSTKKITTKSYSKAIQKPGTRNSFQTPERLVKKTLSREEQKTSAKSQLKLTQKLIRRHAHNTGLVSGKRQSTKAQKVNSTSQATKSQYTRAKSHSIKSHETTPKTHSTAQKIILRPRQASKTAENSKSTIGQKIATKSQSTKPHERTRKRKRQSKAAGKPKANYQFRKAQKRATKSQATNTQEPKRKSQSKTPQKPVTNRQSTGAQKPAAERGPTGEAATKGRTKGPQRAESETNKVLKSAAENPSGREEPPSETSQKNLVIVFGVLVGVISFAAVIGMSIWLAYDSKHGGPPRSDTSLLEVVIHPERFRHSHACLRTKEAPYRLTPDPPAGGSMSVHWVQADAPLKKVPSGKPFQYP